MKIPALIIQTANSRELSSLARASVTNLKLLHPDWDYRFFDGDDRRRFVATEFPQYQDVFNSFPRVIQQVDFFRYLAIYRYGGFYFDLDILLSENLAPLLDCGCVLPFEELTLNCYLRRHHGIDWEVSNYAFGAAPAHPYLAAVIENCVRSQRDPAWVAPMMSHIPRIFRSDYYVLNTTGPGLLTRTMAENPQTTADLTVLFPDDVRDSKNWHLFGNYGVHLMNGSWRDEKNYLHRRLVCLWEIWCQRCLLPESHRLGPRREVPRVNAQPADFHQESEATSSSGSTIVISEF